MNDQPLMIMELIQKYVCDQTLEQKLLEFDFIWALAKKVKQKGCYCGINQQIVKLTPQFNELVENLNPESAARIKEILKKEKLCFGILKNRKFEIKCY